MHRGREFAGGGFPPRAAAILGWSSMIILLSWSSSALGVVVVDAAFADPRPAVGFRRPVSRQGGPSSSTSSSSSSSSRPTTKALPCVLSSNGNNGYYYGKGADIWPPTNEKDPVMLSDSFPNGAIPTQVKSIFQQTTMTTTSDADSSRGGVGGPRRFLPRSVLDRILSGSRELRAEEWIDRAPLAMAILLSAFAKPVDGLWLTAVTGYLCVLSAWSGTKRNDGVTPCLPALPPQGHVPATVLNPLGYELAYSIPYDRWRKLGVVLGLLGPAVEIVHAALVRSDRAAASACARPALWLCCQTLTENFLDGNGGRGGTTRTTRMTTPLPLRILVPILYNAVRLAYIWMWARHPVGRRPSSSRGPQRALAVANLLYWSLNLFAFLVPVASVRYMRAHFFCVEAEQVTTRPGMESSMGLSSYDDPE